MEYKRRQPWNTKDYSHGIQETTAPGAALFQKHTRKHTQSSGQRETHPLNDAHGAPEAYLRFEFIGDDDQFAAACLNISLYSIPGFAFLIFAISSFMNSLYLDGARFTFSPAC